MAYMLSQHQPASDKHCTFEKFCTAGQAVFEHHWNNHERCGDWCQAKTWMVAETEKGKNKYRDKAKNPKEYQQQKKVKDKFTEIKRM